MQASRSIFTAIGLVILMASFNAQAGGDWGFSISISSGHVCVRQHFSTVRTVRGPWHGSPGYYTSWDRYDGHQARVIPQRVTYYQKVPVVVLPRPVVVPRVVTRTIRYAQPAYRYSGCHYRPQPRHTTCSASRLSSHSRRRH